ncbi:MAG: ThiF family adenylyltransferase [Cellvibrionales bacterium]|nr:ThiF family adenylyltransferase [Cellvibrionales bacterium]
MTVTMNTDDESCELFSRMIGVITEDDLAELKTKSIAVVGLGDVGVNHAETLARMGVGGIYLADIDGEYLDKNDPLGCGREWRESAKQLEQRLLMINPSVRIQVFNNTSFEALFDCVDLVCDAMDYVAIDLRSRMYSIARNQGLDVVISSPVGFGASLHIFTPQGMSFDTFFSLQADDSFEEKMSKFGSGLTPSHLYLGYQEAADIDFTHQKSGALGSSCLLASTLTGYSCLMQLLSKQSFKAAPFCYQIDLFASKFEELCLPDGVAGLDLEVDRF